MNSKSVFLNLKSILYLSLILVCFNSCKNKEEVEYLKHSSENSLIDPVNKLVIPCTDDPSDRTCTDGCSCFSPSCCTRNNLDSCSYSNGLDLAVALACELNKALNHCIHQEFEFGCEITTICLEFGYSSASVPTSLTNIRANTNPFRYCSLSDPCDGLVCSGESNPKRHISMSITYIDSIASYIRSRIPIIQCEPNYIQKNGEITVSACKLTGVDCSSANHCWDTHLKVSYDIYCCPQ